MLDLALNKLGHVVPGLGAELVDTPQNPTIEEYLDTLCVTAFSLRLVRRLKDSMIARKIAAGELKGHSAPTVANAVTTFCSLAR